jgi:hypothetical protein
MKICSHVNFLFFEVEKCLFIMVNCSVVIYHELLQMSKNQERDELFIHENSTSEK